MNATRFLCTFVSDNETPCAGHLIKRERNLREREYEIMKTKMAKILAGITVVLTISAGLVFAKGKNINIAYNGEVGSNLTLRPGNYRMVVHRTSPSPEVTFYKNGKALGTVPVQVVAQARKNNQTEVYYSSPKNHVRRITEIDPSGRKDHIVFKNS